MTVSDESTWLDLDYCVKVWTLALLRRLWRGREEEEHLGPDHLTADELLPPPPPLLSSPLLSATQSSGLDATLHSTAQTQARLREPETESSYYPHGVCCFSDDSVMRVAERRDGRFFSSSMWSGSAQKCAPWFSIFFIITILLIFLRSSWEINPQPKTREILPETPVRGNHIFLFSTLLSVWNPPTHTALMQHLNLLRLTKRMFYAFFD